MTNIVQQQEQLKNLSDDQIANEMKQPSGQVPLFLVSTEAKRRADLRERFKQDKAEAPQTSVQEDLLRSIMAGQMQPPGTGQGITQGMQQPQMQQPQQMMQQPQMQPPQMQAPQMMPQAGAMQGVPPQGQGFAVGGAVRGYAQGGGMGRYVNEFDAPTLAQTMANLVANSRINAAANPSTNVEAAYPSGSYVPNPKLLRRFAVGNSLATPSLSGEDFAPPPPPPELNDYMPPNMVEPNFDAENDVEASYPANTYVSDPVQGVPNLTALQRAQMDLTAFTNNPATSASAATSGLGAMPVVAPLNLPDALKLSNKVNYTDAKTAKLAELAKQVDPYAAVADRLAERDASLESDTDQNKYLALAKAGFAMAGGQSQNALSNISAGGLEGLDAYSRGKTALQARADKNMDARTALIGVQEQRKTAQDAIADRHAKGLMSDEERTNALKRADYNSAIKISEITNRSNIAQGQLGAQLRGQNLSQNQFQIGQAADVRRDRLNVLKETVAAERAKETAATLQTNKEKMAELALKTPSALERTARAAMADPELKKTLIELSGKDGSKALQKSIASAWSKVLKPYDDGGSPTLQDVPDMKAMFKASLGNVNLGSDTVDALFSTFMKRSGINIPGGAGGGTSGSLGRAPIKTSQTTR